MEKNFLEFCMMCKERHNCAEFIASHTDIGMHNLEVKAITCAKLSNNLRRTSKEVIQIEINKLASRPNKHSCAICCALEDAKEAFDIAIKYTEDLIPESKSEVIGNEY